MISSSVPYQVFSPSNTFGKQVLQLLSQICTIQETKPDNELCTIQLLFQLWNILQKNMDWTSDSNSIHRLNHKQARLQAMMQYIHDHYMEEITLETIAASASISKSGALHIFQTGIHCSPVAYLIQYRLAQAAEQLYITQKSVSSIAEETGFTSSGYFCRKFRQYYHMSPNEYRKKKTEEIFLISTFCNHTIFGDDVCFYVKHGSWLDIAEIELNVMTRQCLSRRIENIAKLRGELAAWEVERNTVAAKS